MIAFFFAIASAIAARTMQLDSLAKEADRVVVGEVLVNRTESDRKNTWTVSTVRVSETLRGEAKHVIEVRLPGARLQGQDLLVHGQTQLIEGHEVLLFLRGDQLVGMGAGAFVVRDDRAWKNKYDWTYADPKTSGSYMKDLYVSHDMDAVRSTLR